jgi:hypothetical protein
VGVSASTLGLGRLEVDMTVHASRWRRG